MMQRTDSPVPSHVVTGTEISKVLVICKWKAMQYKHLRKVPSDLLRQCCNETLDTTARSSNDPMPDRDMDRNSIVTSESCRQRIRSVLKEFGLADRSNVVEIQHHLD